MLHCIVVERPSHASYVLALIPVARQDCSGGNWIRGCDQGQWRREGYAFYQTAIQVRSKPCGRKGRRHMLVLIDGEKNALHGISPDLTDNSRGSLGAPQCYCISIFQKTGAGACIIPTRLLRISER